MAAAFLAGRAEAACSSSTWTGVPCAPEAPPRYTLPSSAVVVSNSAQLITALSRQTAVDIILEDGTYSSSSKFYPYAGHRLWARHVGKAVLQTGLEIDKPSFEVHGLKFTISSSSKLAAGAAIHSFVGNYGRVGDKLWVTDVTSPSVPSTPRRSMA
jgi:hypothetical protein